MASKDKPVYECIDVVRKAPVATTYWGNWLVKDTIILASGYGGISKTTFFFSLILSLMDEGQFLGVEGQSNIKVLYCDFESSDSLEKSRMKLLGRLEKNHPNFHRVNQPPDNFKQVRNWIEFYIAQEGYPDLLFLDPLSLAFPETQNENSNAEATRQSKILRQAREKWCTTIVGISHSSKIDLYGAGHNRGASARAFLADIAWNFHKLGDNFPESQFALHIPKNRWLHDEFFQCIEKQEGEFAPITTPAGLTLYGQGEGLNTYQLQLKIQELMRDGTAREVRTIMSELGFDLDSITESVRVMFYRALTPLVQLDKLDRVARGWYQWCGSCIN